MGALRPGDQLPTVKQVVAEVTINPNTVTKAYRELEHAGLGRGAPGRRHLRGPPAAGPPPEEQMRLARRLERWVETARTAGLDDQAMEAMLRSILQQRVGSGRRMSTRGHSRSRPSGSPSATDRRGACRTARSTCRRAASRRWSARTAPARRRSCDCSSGCAARPREGPCARTRARAGRGLPRERRLSRPGASPSTASSPLPSTSGSAPISTAAGTPPLPSSGSRRSGSRSTVPCTPVWWPASPGRAQPCARQAAAGPLARRAARRARSPRPARVPHLPRRCDRRRRRHGDALLAPRARPRACLQPPHPAHSLPGASVRRHRRRARPPTGCWSGRAGAPPSLNASSPS